MASLSMSLEVLALVFIRKLLDFFFTKRELSWLDDLIPESKKKKEDDKKKKAREKLVNLQGNVQLFYSLRRNVTFEALSLNESIKRPSDRPP